jgi:hypothetical protein
MKNLFIKKKIKNFLMKYIYLQNCISLFCLPLYITYGISFSALSILGNFLFPSFLLAYLFSSILIMALSWNQIVSQTIIIFQEYILNIWLYIMEQTAMIIPHQALQFIEYYYFHYIFSWLCLILLLFLKKNITQDPKTMMLTSCIFLGTTIVLLIYSPEEKKITVIEDKNSYYIIRKTRKNTFAIISIKDNKLNTKKIKGRFLKKKIKETIQKKYSHEINKIMII